MIDVHVHYPGSGNLAGDFTGRPCESLDRGEAESLLAAMGGASRQINPKRLVPGAGLATRRRICPEADAFQIEPARGKLAAHIPVVVKHGPGRPTRPPLSSSVNRTLITAEIHASRRMKDKGAYGLMGSGLSNEHDHTALPLKAGRGREYSLVVNVTTPYIPITTDGKRRTCPLSSGPSETLSKRPSAARSGKTATATATRRPRPQSSPRPYLPRRHDDPSDLAGG